MRNTYFVSSDGRNDNEGSMKKPWRTINYAVKRLRPGDKLYIREGQYQIQQPINLVNLDISGTEHNKIIISGYKDEKANLDYPLFQTRRVSGTMK